MSTAVQNETMEKKKKKQFYLKFQKAVNPLDKKDNLMAYALEETWNNNLLKYLNNQKSHLNAWKNKNSFLNAWKNKNSFLNAWKNKNSFGF